MGSAPDGRFASGQVEAHPFLAGFLRVLAVLTSVLILNGCDKQGAAEQASEQIGKAAQEQPLFDEAAPQPAPAEAAAPAAESMGEPAQPGTSEPAAENPRQAGEAPQQP
jgi:hypothetical protein